MGFWTATSAFGIQQRLLIFTGPAEVYVCEWLSDSCIIYHQIQ